jgi:hypothetical protein
VKKPRQTVRRRAIDFSDGVDSGRVQPSRLERDGCSCYMGQFAIATLMRQAEGESFQRVAKKMGKAIVIVG